MHISLCRYTIVHVTFLLLIDIEVGWGFCLTKNSKMNIVYGSFASLLVVGSVCVAQAVLDFVAQVMLPPQPSST